MFFPSALCVESGALCFHRLLFTKQNTAQVVVAPLSAHVNQHAWLQNNNNNNKVATLCMATINSLLALSSLGDFKAQCTSLHMCAAAYVC